ncbi:TOBE domain-containing protein [Echinicola jeungdonensis]|uniref:Molybdopterin-binding protein n=1 Tax=Echinicola jeungdonensis TaxID=709343 RepID=A0ABV5J269_9BACT|nr:TOBE domain-containing protein [Echinicola jeungdonensis]MDN3671074.1 TOBE domain-containing protein [Echinicola jeungdonensis]
MNNLKGTIKNISVDQQITLVDIQVGNLDMLAIVIDTPEHASYLKLGRKVKVIFKETEVIIAHNPISEISLQNKIPGKILRMEENALLTKIELDTNLGPLSSIITTRSAHHLNLQPGQSVVALVKTNEVMLSV